MATISDLENAPNEPRLWKVDAALDPTELELRRFYASSKLRSWALTTLPNLVSAWNIELTPQEQLNEFLATYAIGEPLVFGRQFHVLQPAGYGVWEVKTADLRIFGWFSQKDCFIGHSADTTDRIKQYGLYAGYRDEVAKYRDVLPLDEPKFVSGEDPNDVVSNFYYP